MAKLSDDDLNHVLGATTSLWPQMNDERLFVTGGTGFFGTWLLETFLAARERFGLGAEVVVLTRDAEAFEARAPHIARGVTLHEGDLRSFTFPKGPFHFVIHAGTESSAKLNESRPLEMFDTILAGTRRVLDFATAAGTRRFLFTSSGAVYGRQPHNLTHIDEEHNGSPVLSHSSAAYAEGKRAAELLCALYAHQNSVIEPVIARCFAFVGPHLPLDAHFAIGNFIGDALARRPVQIRGDGTPIRSYLYAADLAIWLWTIMFRGEALRPYNVGSEEPVSIRDAAIKVGRSTDPPQPVEVATMPTPGQPPERYVPSTQRAQHELGLRVTVPLNDAIARTITWHRERTRRDGEA